LLASVIISLGVRFLAVAAAAAAVAIADAIAFVDTLSPLRYDVNWEEKTVAAADAAGTY